MFALRTLLALLASAAFAAPAGAKPLRILFTGNSFTHGRYLPVRTYHGGFGGDAGHVHDDNCLSPDACTEAGRRPRSSGTDEFGPFGGIPGIFLTLTEEAGLSYDVSINAVSSATLARTAADPGRVRAIANDPLTGAPFDIVVLQEQSFLALPPTNALGRATRGNPAQFTAAINQLVAAIDAADTAARRETAKVFLYETQPLASYTYADTGGRHPYAGAPIAVMAADLHRGYAAAAAQNPAIAGVAYAGDAWIAAMDRGIAERDPFQPDQRPGAVDLWDSDPAAACCTTPIGYHPSTYGAYLNALVLFHRITGQDPSRFGPAEMAAKQLGLAPGVAAALQRIAVSTPADGE